MKTKIWRLLLTTSIVWLIWATVFIQYKNHTITTQASEINKLQATQDLIYTIETDQEAIIYLRQEKIKNCELLWVGMPVSLLDICWMPVIE